MRTNVWMVAVVMLGGCTGNTISLDTDGETGGTQDGTETSPPADSGSDDGPQPECTANSDCSGPCSWCDLGVCQEDVGCCSAVPEQPWVWHCSPPLDCYEDIECGDGMVCNNGYCEPGPATSIFEPPACRGDLALAVQQLALDAPLSQVVVVEGAGMLAIDENLQVVTLDLVGGVTPPEGPIDGAQVVRELLAVGTATALAISEQTSPAGAIEYQLNTVITGGDVFAISSPGGWAPGPMLAAAWLGGGSLEVVVASGDHLDRWDFAGPDATGAYALGFMPTAIAPVQSPAGTTMIGMTLDTGVGLVLDPATEAVAANTEGMLGQPVDLLGHGPELVALASVAAGQLPMQPLAMAAIQVLRLQDGLVPGAPFGAPGVPTALAMADMDGDGIDDVLVGNVDGRLDLYLMNSDGPRCHTFIPLAPILDVESGDVDGDGRPDVLVLDAGPSVTALFGAAPL